jgi:hypothetical protein
MLWFILEHCTNISIEIYEKFLRHRDSFTFTLCDKLKNKPNFLCENSMLKQGKIKPAAKHKVLQLETWSSFPNIHNSLPSFLKSLFVQPTDNLLVHMWLPVPHSSWIIPHHHLAVNIPKTFLWHKSCGSTLWQHLLLIHVDWHSNSKRESIWYLFHGTNTCDPPSFMYHTFNIPYYFKYKMHIFHIFSSI